MNPTKTPTISSFEALNKRDQVTAKNAVLAGPVGPIQCQILNLLEKYSNPLDRNCRPGHLTGSSLIIRPQDSQILVLFHAKLKRWLQPGGHADSDGDMARVALREAIEETGIPQLEIVEPPIDLDIHVVDPPYEDVHEHHDVRYLVLAPEDSCPVGNRESTGFQWMDPDEIQRIDPDDGFIRMVERGLNMLSTLQAAYPRSEN
ncbi:MAG TPA: NUDIX hydrolase [Arenicellales bacterium]|nr:NUDIX hydrolase [Arenicellales bacterium]HJL51532.1 NUDIX hydrolase [Arenicellales bacterium]